MYLRSWLLSVTACAVLVSIAQQLTHGSTMRSAVRFTGGLLLLIALLRPLVTIELDVPAVSLSDYRAAVAQIEAQLTAQRDDALRAGIAAQTQAYIEDKAGELGADVRASVETEERGGESIPVSVTLYGERNAALSALIARELGITEERQIWIEGKQEDPP